MRTALLGLFLLAPSAFALEPKDVIVVVNRNVPESRDVAEHYLAKRKVPKENLILLDLPKGEDISRAEYDAKLAGPLREALKDRRAEVKVLLAVYCCANGEQERGVRLLREARTESPSYPLPPLILGQLAARQHQWSVAREQFAAAMLLPIPANWPESHRQRYLVLLHSERLRLAQQLQDFELARDALSQWLKCDPENPKLRQMAEELRKESGK